ncbi:hypothetical protein ABZW96_35885 [Nocardia sp. NPDC004168]|uniref:hypothetical protein n=1 Tax=Nocardia sp. NPDC004168 TaxID=3154452 RepID=UPI0033B69BB3
MTSWREKAGGHGFGRMIELSVEAVVNTVGQRAGCAPLTWELYTADETSGLAVTGIASGRDYNDSQVTAIVQAWADLLGLIRVVPPTTSGTIEYRGVVDGIEVEVWGITDKQFFELISQLEIPE